MNTTPTAPSRQKDALQGAHALGTHVKFFGHPGWAEPAAKQGH